MKKVIVWAAGLLIAMAGATAQAAGEKGTTQEAQALVKKAIAYYDKNGKDKTIGELVKTPGPFVDRDLYVTIYNMQGDCLAHINPKVTKKVEPKRVYWEKHDNLIFAAGAYKPA